jgi:hypothetical protein
MQRVGEQALVVLPELLKPFLNAPELREGLEPIWLPMGHRLLQYLHDLLRAAPHTAAACACTRLADWQLVLCAAPAAPFLSCVQPEVEVVHNHLHTCAIRAYTATMQ